MNQPDQDSQFFSPIEEPQTRDMSIQESHFSPSLGMTEGGGFFPGKAFSSSESCGFSGCHSDIFRQWRSSAHHFSSFNNPFYKRTVEAFSEQRGFASTKFCGGCHDPVLLFSGKMDKEIDPTSSEAQAGIVCLSCHAITQVSSVRGNGSYVLGLPERYPFSNHESPFLQSLHRFLIRVKPGPHRKAFLKPLHQEAEFCAVCHKVSIDLSINQYRWKRGQDEYDSWQMSAFSGEVSAPIGDSGKDPKDCNACHMPKVESEDMGGEKGKVQNHRFATANTALPHLFGDTEQITQVEALLKNQQVTLDLVAARGLSGQNLSQKRERAESFLNDEEDWVFPLEPEKFPIVCGGEFLFEVVVNNKGVGHAFPGGTIDAQEVWLEFLVRNSDGKKLFHSGFLQTNGEVDPKAHFYGAVLLNERGEQILHRDIQNWVSTGYRNVISPGGADVVHYKVSLPEKCVSWIEIEAKLHYRKFRPAFTEFVFTKTDEVNPDLYSFPIVTMAESKIRLIHDPGEAKPNSKIFLSEQSKQRLNQYGLGLFQQGDLRRGAAVFKRLLDSDEGFSEGRVRLIRILLAEGSIREAQSEVERLLELSPESEKGLVLKGIVEKELGNYTEALMVLGPMSERYPRDRDLWRQIGEIHLLQGAYQRSYASFEKVAMIDPEDAGAYYGMSLALRGIGDQERSALKMALYEKYKVSEEEKSLSTAFKRENPLFNLEAQPIHIHD